MSKAEKRAKERYWLESNNIETQKKYTAYIEGYHQAEKDLKLTWEDINTIHKLINQVSYEYPHGISEKSFGEEVLKRFKEQRDEDTD